MAYLAAPPDKNTVTSALLTSTLPVPTHGPNGSFSILAKVHIKASPAACLAAVRNTKTWPVWNTFCPSCAIDPSSSSLPASGAGPGIGEEEKRRREEKDGWLEKGTVATMRYVMSGEKDGAKGEQGFEVSVCEEEWIDEVVEEQTRDGDKRRIGCRIAWISTGRPNWMLRSERVMEFVDDGDGGCEYVCWETFAGRLGPVVRVAVGAKLRDRFGDYARDLKGYVEGVSRGGGG